MQKALVILLLCGLLNLSYGFVGSRQSTRWAASVTYPQTQTHTQKWRATTDIKMAVDVLPTIASATAVAGVVAFHEAGHFLAAKGQGMKVQSYNIGYGPKIVAFNDSDDTEFALRAVPLGGFVAFPVNVEFNEEGEITGEIDDPDLLQNRPPIQRALVISGGVLANILLTFLLSAGTASTIGIGRPTFSDGVTVTTVRGPTSPGGMAGIKPGDVITKLGGETVKGNEIMVQEFINKVHASTDSPLAVEILRSDGKSSKTIQTSVTPLGPEKRGSIGIGINPIIKEVKRQKATNPIEAFQIGVDETNRLFDITWKGLKQAVTAGVNTGSADVGGPIAVVNAGASLAKVDPIALIGFAATLSINLALINSLPIPALDGGQLVFCLAELVSGKKIPRETQDAITTAAFGMLFVFGVSTLLGDISKLIPQ